jgi:hypothetical protein
VSGRRGERERGGGRRRVASRTRTQSRFGRPKLRRRDPVRGGPFAVQSRCARTFRVQTPGLHSEYVQGTLRGRRLATRPSPVAPPSRPSPRLRPPPLAFAATLLRPIPGRRGTASGAAEGTVPAPVSSSIEHATLSKMPGPVNELIRRRACRSSGPGRPDQERRDPRPESERGPTVGWLGRVARLGALLLVAGCAGRADSRVESITPARPAALAGAPTVVTVSMTSECWKSCRETARPVLELDTGAPLPSSLRYELMPTTSGYFIGNPGSSPPFQTAPASCPGWTYAAWSVADGVFAGCQTAAGIRGFSVRLVTDPATSPTRFALRLRIPDCGAELLASFTLDLVGAAQTPGMCADSTGASCSVDADCSWADGYTCRTCDAARPSVGLCPESVLPGPAGASCGCVAGICSWH